jgi:hypothetical protein
LYDVRSAVEKVEIIVHKHSIYSRLFWQKVYQLNNQLFTGPKKYYATRPLIRQALREIAHPHQRNSPAKIQVAGANVTYASPGIHLLSANPERRRSMDSDTLERSCDSLVEQWARNQRPT